MQYCGVLCFTWCILALLGTGIAKDATIDFPTSITAGEEYSGSCTFKHNGENLEVITMTKGCNMTESTPQNKRLINFSLTCEQRNGPYTAKLECYSSNDNCDATITVIPKPKITSSSTNVTTMAGLPVTLSCHVEGDPNHYWVGWMHRESTIQQGEQYAMSTTRTTRGTRHHLTIHTVKKPGEYKCKVFTIKGPADQKSHHVTIENDVAGSTPQSLMDVLKKLLFS